MRWTLILLGIGGLLLGSAVGIGPCFGQAEEEEDDYFSDDPVSFQVVVPPKLTTKTPSFGQPATSVSGSPGPGSPSPTSTPSGLTSPSTPGLGASKASRESGFTTQLKDSWYWYLKQTGWGISRSEETSSKPK